MSGDRDAAHRRQAERRREVMGRANLSGFPLRTYAKRKAAGGRFTPRKKPAGKLSRRVSARAATDEVELTASERSLYQWRG